MEPEKEENNFSCELGVLDQCDGSVLLQNGDCVVLCGIQSVVAVPHSREIIGKAYVEVTFRTITGEQDVRQRCIEQSVRGIVTQAVLTSQYPRSMISIVLHELEHSAELTLATCVNAVSLALLDTAVSMTFVPLAVTCLVTPPSSPPAPESASVVSIAPVVSNQCDGADHAAVCIVFNSVTFAVVAMETVDTAAQQQLSSCPGGRQLSAADLSSCCRLALPAAQQLHLLCRRAVGSKFGREMAWRADSVCPVDAAHRRTVFKQEKNNPF